MRTSSFAPALIFGFLCSLPTARAISNCRAAHASLAEDLPGILERAANHWDLLAN